MTRINLYENIVKLKCLMVNSHVVGVRVCSLDEVYDISSYLLKKEFGEDIIEKMVKVLDSSVFIKEEMKIKDRMYLSRDELSGGLSIVPQKFGIEPSLHALVSKLSVIADFKDGNGDTGVVSVGGRNEFLEDSKNI